MNKKKINSEALNHLLKKMVDNKNIFSAVMKVENSEGSISWSGAAGSMQADSHYFIASVTKLYITAIIMRLIEESKITLNDKISNYLPDNYCEGLHVLKGRDYTNDLTIHHLITNTSGIPDYFFHVQENGRTVADELMEGKDEPWPIDRTIELIKKLKPNFRPGAKRRASYSDSNYQLLGKIIENIEGKSIGEVLHDYIFSQLNFKNTYTYNDPDDNSPVPFYYNARKLWLPRYMTSIGPEGGIVSIVDEVMIFLKAFFKGRFFPKEKIDELKKWNIIFPPPGLFCFGIGLEKLWIPWIASPIKHPGDILGFWGQTGSFAFYNPKSDLYLCGTTNQVNGRGHRAATRAMLKIIKSML
jgi:D-alanyl-D-alanine carboxypeptidase